MIYTKTKIDGAIVVLDYKSKKVKDSNISDGFKYIYIFSNPAFPNQYKIGQSKNWKKRLNQYQTADPDRAFKHEFSIETKGYSYVEESTHRYFSANREWIKSDLKEIINKIKYYSKKYINNKIKYKDNYTK